VIRAPLLTLALVLALAGCGGETSGSSSPEDALAETAANLGEIRSGELLLEVTASADEDEVGFRLEGPFAFAESEGELPVAELEYTQIAGDREATVTFVSTGERAWVVSDGEAQEITETAPLESLRGSGSGGGGGGPGLGELGIGDWFVDPEISDGGEVGGAETDEISSELDVVAAANDLLALLQALGRDGPEELDERSAEQLRRAVESATVEVWTGKEDRLLRRLVADASFEAEPPEELRDALGDVPRAALHLELGISDPNGDVSVEPPPGS
jgi:hypothetical protein